MLATAWINYKNTASYFQLSLSSNGIRSHAASASRYEKLNRELARRFPHDIDSYIEGKREFIENILSNPTG